jgi:hypothetical protein
MRRLRKTGVVGREELAKPLGGEKIAGPSRLAMKMKPNGNSRDKEGANP